MDFQAKTHLTSTAITGRAMRASLTLEDLDSNESFSKWSCRCSPLPLKAYSMDAIQAIVRPIKSFFLEFSWKNTTFIWSNFGRFRGSWGHWSVNRRTFLFSFLIFLSNLCKKSKKNIWRHPHSTIAKGRRKSLFFLIQRSFFDFPMIQGGSFSDPSALSE